MELEITGKKIKDVRYLTKEELARNGWRFPCIVLVLDDGSIIYPSRDEEGKDSGCLFIHDSEGEYSHCLI